MRNLRLAVLTSLLAVSPAAAQWNGSVHWGMMRGNAILLAPSLTDYLSGTTWFYGDADLGYAVNDRFSILIGVGGFDAESSGIGDVQGIGVTAKVGVTVVTIPVFARLSLSGPDQTFGPFAEAGPSVSSVGGSVTTSGAGVSFKLGGREMRGGVTMGLGLVTRVGRLKLIPRVRYHFISRPDGATLDPSSVAATIGLGFGRM